MGANSAFNPPSAPFPNGGQAGFLQRASQVSQNVGTLSGDYVVSFALGSRYSDGTDGNVSVAVLLDGQQVGDVIALSSFAPWATYTRSFTVSTEGTHTLAFEQLHSGDHTAFLDAVQLDSVPEPGPFLLLGSGLLIVGMRLRRR